MTQINKTYDLEERVSIFGERVIEFCKSLDKNLVVKPLALQLVRSATSIGANYMEANCASSRRDFVNKIAICSKESRETKYWLRMMAIAVGRSETLINLAQESLELTLIFHKISGTLNSKYKLVNKN